MKSVAIPRYYKNASSLGFWGAKYEAILNELLKEQFISLDDIKYCDVADEEDLHLIHSWKYLQDLNEKTLTQEELEMLEIPLTEETLKFYLSSVEATIEASRMALDLGVGINIGGGWHHAYTAMGTGFCMLNDIAVATRKLLDAKSAQRILIIDLDVHQGDGTAKIFEHEKQIFTFSMHQKHLFPYRKQRSSLDVELEDGCDDKTYLRLLTDNLPIIANDFKPDFIFYMAGADSYKDDRLGGLKLSMSGLKKRDEAVFKFAQTKHNIPICVTLAGGYANKFEELVNIQSTTVKLGLDLQVEMLNKHEKQQL